MKIIECEQGSIEWHAARCGKVTASCMADMTAKIKTGYGASRANYMSRLLIERLTGVVAESYESPEMRWGKETEPTARAMYELMHSASVATVGFVLHPEIEMAGASPDGLVGDVGLIEIKCPTSANHVATLLAESVPEKYVKQMQFQMACCDRAWCDFVSFDPRMPGDMQLFVKRIARDEAMISELEGETRKFLAELAKMHADLVGKYRTEEAA